MSTPFGESGDRAIERAVVLIFALVFALAVCAFVAWMVILLIGVSWLYPVVLGGMVGCGVVGWCLRMLVWRWRQLSPRQRLAWMFLFVAALAGPPLLDGLLNGAPDPRLYVGIVVLSLVMAMSMEFEVRRHARRRSLRPVNDRSAGAP